MHQALATRLKAFCPQRPSQWCAWHGPAMLGGPDLTNAPFLVIGHHGCSRPMNAPKIICHNHMQPHACAGCHPKALLKFSTFASESAGCASELAASHGPHGLEACLALCVGPQWPELANTCWGLLSACVGTVPCTWLHTARLFWCVNTFWPPLGHFPVTTGILAVFCRLWATANWVMVGARPRKVAQSLL